MWSPGRRIRSKNERGRRTRRRGAASAGPTEDQGGGTYRSSGAELPFPGAWELFVTVRTSDIDQDRFSTTFVVRQLLTTRRERQ